MWQIMITWLPFDKYVDYILASYIIGFIILSSLFVLTFRQKKQTIIKLEQKYQKQQAIQTGGH